MSVKFPQYISTKERTVSIVGYVNSKEECSIEDFKDGKGYVDEEGYVWIYCAQGKPKNSTAYPYFWIKDNKAEFSNVDDYIKSVYNIDKLMDMSLVNIINTTEPNEVLFDEEEINNIISSASFYVPEIKKDDDYLKKLVKYTIIKKKIDINKLKNKTDEKYMLPNMKAALNSSTKTSVIYFALWMDLLGCTFDITISDSGEDKADPLKTPIVYESATDKISDLVHGELIEANLNTRPDMSSEEEG